MTAPVVLLLALAVCSTIGHLSTLELAANGNNTSISKNTTWTNSIKGRVNFVTRMVSLDRKNRIFNGTALKGPVNGHRHRRVKRDEDPCTFFQYSGHDQVDIWHPHSNDDPNNSNYYREINCVTVINGSEGSILELTFIDVFSIESHPECGYDYLEIRDGYRGYAPLLGGKKLCGQKFPQPIVTTGPYAWLKFHSDDTIEQEGFHIKIAVKPAAKSHAVSENCHIKMGGVEGILDLEKLGEKCKDESKIHGYDILWTIEAAANHKINLNFTLFKLAEANSCEENLVQVFGSVVEFDSKLAHYCGSIAEYVTTKVDNKKIPNDPGNVMHVRLFTTKASKEDTKFEAHYTVYRSLDATDENDECTEEEFDCQDSTCIAKDLACDKYSNCRLKKDEDADLCKGETYSAFSDKQILAIFITFTLILTGMIIVFLYKCFWKLYQDQKIIKERMQEERQSELNSLARRLSLHPRTLESPGPRASLERDNLTNEMFQERRSSSQEQDGSMDSVSIQETHLDLEDELGRRELLSIPVGTKDISVQQNGRTKKEEFLKREREVEGRTRRNDISKKEETLKSEREVKGKTRRNDISKKESLNCEGEVEDRTKRDNISKEEESLKSEKEVKGRTRRKDISKKESLNSEGEGRTKRNNMSKDEESLKSERDAEGKTRRNDMGKKKESLNSEGEVEGRTKQNDRSIKEESLKSEREVEEKELRDVSVGTLDTKESGCQTRDSLFQTAPLSGSDGSGRNSRRLSVFGYPGATIAKPSSPPRTTASEITIELLRQETPLEPVQLQNIIPDRRPKSNETTRSAPDVIIV